MVLPHFSEVLLCSMILLLERDFWPDAIPSDGMLEMDEV